MTSATMAPPNLVTSHAREFAAREGPVARVVLLGASNLTRAISTAVETARLALGGPLEIFAAMGLGRSYGIRTRVLGRSLPGILDCGLWEAMHEAGVRRPELPTLALLTDIGNDIIYEVDPATICTWIDRCVDRLRAAGAERITITQLPLPTINRLSRPAYFIARSILFPFRTITLGEVKEAADRVNDHVLSVAERGRFPAPPHEADWYGFDPVHYLRRHGRSAWTRFLQDWKAPATSHADAGSLPGGFSARGLRWARPRDLSWLGLPLGRHQPAIRLNDGTTLSLF